AARTSSIRRDARSTLDMTRETGLDLEQRLDLVALLAQLLELALQAALRQHPGARADAHLVAVPLHVADRHHGQRGAVLALDAERRSERPPLDAAVGLP